MRWRLEKPRKYSDTDIPKSCPGQKTTILKNWRRGNEY